MFLITVEINMCTCTFGKKKTVLLNKKNVLIQLMKLVLKVIQLHGFKGVFWGLLML